MNFRKGGASEKAVTAAPSDQPVKFRIADDDEDEKTNEKDTLMKPPQIFIESPTSAKGSSDQPTKV